MHVIASGFSIDKIRASDEPSDKSRLRSAIKRIRRIDLLQVALVHDGDSIRGHHRLGLIMGHVHHGDLELVVQPADFEAHLLAQVRIEVGERFVQQQHGGLDHNGPRQGHALLLPATQFSRITVAQIAHLHHLEDLTHATADLVGLEIAYLQTKAHVLRHSHVGPDSVALKDHRHLPLFRRQAGGGRGNHLAIQLDGAGRGRHESRDHAQRRRLATARRPQQ